MALNFDKIGRSLAVIKNGKYNNKIVSISPDENKNNRYTQMVC